MKNATKLNQFLEHPLKREIRNLKLKQYDLCRSLDLAEPMLSKMLNGISEMPLDLEQKIIRIIHFVSEQNSREVSQ